MKSWVFILESIAFSWVIAMKKMNELFENHLLTIFELAKSVIQFMSNLKVLLISTPNKALIYSKKMWQLIASLFLRSANLFGLTVQKTEVIIQERSPFPVAPTTSGLRAQTKAVVYQASVYLHCSMEQKPGPYIATMLGFLRPSTSNASSRSLASLGKTVFPTSLNALAHPASRQL